MLFSKFLRLSGKNLEIIFFYKSNDNLPLSFAFHPVYSSWSKYFFSMQHMHLQYNSQVAVLPFLMKQFTQRNHQLGYDTGIQTPRLFQLVFSIPPEKVFPIFAGL